MKFLSQNYAGDPIDFVQFTLQLAGISTILTCFAFGQSMLWMQVEMWVVN